MKISYPVTPPHKILVSFALSAALLISGCGASSPQASSSSASDPASPPVSASEAPESSSAIPDTSISGFCDFPWGTDPETVQAAKITAGMQNGTDYIAGTEDGYYGISITNSSVGGHVASCAFLFLDNSLSMGLYALDNISDEAFSDLLKKYTAQYGDPVAREKSKGWGQCAVWTDNSKNCIIMSQFIRGIYYISNGDPYIQTACEILSKNHGMDLQALLDQAGNTDGI